MRFLRALAAKFKAPLTPTNSPSLPRVSPHDQGLDLNLQSENEDLHSSYTHDQDIQHAVDQLAHLADEQLAAPHPHHPTSTEHLSQHDLDQEVATILRSHPDDVPALIATAGALFNKADSHHNNKRLAAKLFESIAVDHQDPTGMYSYGMCLQQGQGVTPDEPLAARMFARAARRGHPWAQYALAQAFHSGTGVEEDHPEALNLFKLAAQNGIPPAPFNVANMYAAGEGVAQDDDAAVEWYGRAADLGDPKAKFALGSRHCSGRGVEEDWDIGYQYHVEAANEGYAPAQFNAGTHYFIGQGVEQDFAKAFSWFQKASDQGMSQASFNLGQMYFNGRGVEENHGKGVALMEKASSLGNKDATQVLVDIEKEKKAALKEGRVVDGMVGEAEVEEGVVVNEKK